MGIPAPLLNDGHASQVQTAQGPLADAGGPEQPSGNPPRDSDCIPAGAALSFLCGPEGSLFIEILASSIASYPERWRDGPCETLATCASKVPIPAGVNACVVVG